jgi:hypothetical protein
MAKDRSPGARTGAGWGAPVNDPPQTAGDSPCPSDRFDGDQPAALAPDRPEAEAQHRLPSALPAALPDEQRLTGMSRYPFRHVLRLVVAEVAVVAAFAVAVALLTGGSSQNGERAAITVAPASATVAAPRVLVVPAGRPHHAAHGRPARRKRRA